MNYSINKHLPGLLLVLHASTAALAQEGSPSDPPSLFPSQGTGNGKIDILPPPTAERVPEKYRIVSSLYQAAVMARTTKPEDVRKALGETFIPLRDDGFFEIEIVAQVDTEPVTVEFIQEFGAIADSRWRNYFEVHIHHTQLLALAEALPAGQLITRATAGEPDDVTGEGPQRIGSDTYRDGGADGWGKTIAVIDGGYQGLTAARGNGDAPTLANSTLVDYTGSGIEASSFHGTGCVEAAFDHCPGATWRIYKVNSVADGGTVVTNGETNDVDIYTHSLSRYNLGWFDNSGGACAYAKQAADDGALFFTSAGNRAMHHYKEIFAPSSGNWHDFGLGDETINITMDPGDRFGFYLSWNVGGGVQDLDLYLYNSTATTVLRSSTSTGETYEEFDYTNNTGVVQVVNLAIWRAQGTTPEFEVFGHGLGVWERFTNASSITSPSNTTDADVIAVAAVDQGDFDSASMTFANIQDYSSQGPSNSGMTVPDMAGPTNTAGFVWGTFGGTSSATPNCAGAACALWSSVPAWSNSAIRWVMRRQALNANDWGVSGDDNVFGYGGANFHPFAPGTVWLSRAWNNILNATSGPYYALPDAYSAVPNNGRILILEGGSYPEVPVGMTKVIEIDIVDDPATLGS